MSLTDYNMILDHDLGADCIANTPDDDTDNVGDDDCPPNFVYDWEICNCVLNPPYTTCPNHCVLYSPYTDVGDTFGCTCVDDDWYAQLLDHNRGPGDCTVKPEELTPSIVLADD